MTLQAEVDASLAVQLGRVAGALESAERWRRDCAGALQQATIPVNNPNAAGVIDLPDLLACKTGYVWSIRRLVVTGFSAGSVAVYKNAVGGEIVAPFPSAAVFTYGKGQLVLQPGERLIFAGTGLTGTIQAWVTPDIMESWYYPVYAG